MSTTRNVALVCVSGLLTSVLSSCGFMRQPISPWLGSTFDGTTSPVDVEFHDTSIGSKKGRSAQYNVLWLLAWGDAGVVAAAKKGNLSRVDQIDHRYLNVFGVFQKYETIVSGE